MWRQVARVPRGARLPALAGWGAGPSRCFAAARDPGANAGEGAGGGREVTTVRLAPSAGGRAVVGERVALSVAEVLRMDPSIHARDLRVFPGLELLRPATQPPRGAAQAAESLGAVAVRRSGFHVIARRGTILVSLPGPIEALLRHDCALVMSGADEMRDGLARALTSEAAGGYGPGSSPLPWELLVLETALSLCVARLRAKVGRLVPVIQHELERIAASGGGEQGVSMTRLLPLKHQLSHLTSEAHEIIRGLASLVADSAALADLRLTAKHRRVAGDDVPGDATGTGGTGSDDEAETMLVAYQREADACLHALRNAHEEVDNTQELLAVALEGGTNALLQINLRLATATLATAAAAVPAAVLGMNVPSGLEENANVFWPLTGALVFVAASLYSLVMRYVSGSLAESARHAEHVSAVRSALSPATLEGVERVLLRAHHADPGARISRFELMRLLAADPHAPTPSDHELRAIFNMLDLDDDGTVHHSEFFRLARGHER